VKGIARTTFVNRPDGKIAHVFNNVKADGHADEVLAYLKGAAVTKAALSNLARSPQRTLFWLNAKCLKMLSAKC